MSKFVSTSLGGTIGVLLFGRFISSAHRFDWPRAIFVGLFMGLASWVYYRYKSSKAQVAA